MAKRGIASIDWDTKTLSEQIASIPVHSIATIVSNRHVSTSDAEIADDWRNRAIASGASDYQVRRIVQIALAAHHDNKGLYHSVMSGKL